MNIGIDFDRVLFDTDSFNEYLKQETGLHEVDADLYDENGCYSPEKHAEACGIEVKKVYNAMNNLNQFLYNDIDKLRSLKPQHKLFIVTRGKEKFQRQKIKASGAQRLFDQMLIVQNASKDIGNIDFLADDTKEEIEAVDIPKMLFDRKKHSTKDIIRKIGELD